MRASSILSLIALPLAALAAVADIDEPLGFELVEDENGVFKRQVSTSACPKKGIHIIAGPGANGVGPEDYGYLNTTIKAVQRAIPGSNNFCLGPYVGSNGLYQTENGEHQARQHLFSFHKRCPHTPIAFITYSSGAIAAMNLLCGASPAPPWTKTKAINKADYNVFALTTFGDETRKAGKPFNRGSCHAPYQAPAYPRTTDAGCHAFFDNMAAWCDAADGDCCNAPGAINGGPAHFTYPEKYNSDVVRFVKKRLHAYHKKRAEERKHHKKHHHHKEHHHKKHHNGE